MALLALAVKDAQMCERGLRNHQRMLDALQNTEHHPTRELGKDQTDAKEDREAGGQHGLLPLRLWGGRLPPGLTNIARRLGDEGWIGPGLRDRCTDQSEGGQRATLDNGFLRLDSHGVQRDRFGGVLHGESPFEG
jgi:hypothetical protein